MDNEDLARELGEIRTEINNISLKISALDVNISAFNGMKTDIDWLKWIQRTVIGAIIGGYMGIIYAIFFK